ncbi:MAG: RHS repeat-associated core domain-containing protein, partial [Chitinophagaceae bacterium]
GSGQELMKKLQAEPGPATQVNPDGSITVIADTSPNLRWVGNGRVIFNNKGKAVKRYEPYFSVLPAFDDEKEIVELGVTAVMHYDSMGRVIKTDFPNKTFSKVEFTPWVQRSFDPNDTVDKSGWFDERILNPVPSIATPDEVNAAQKSLLHKNTPTVAHLDTLGRAFFTEADNGTEKISSRVVHDITGKELEVKDALNRIVMQYEYDLLARNIRQISMDAGARLAIMGVDNHPILTWDDRNHEFSFEYDKLRRGTKSFVKIGNGQPILVSSVEYGDSLTPSVAKNNNLVGAPHKKFDQAGVVTTIKNDFKGNALSCSRQLLQDYKNMIDWANPGAVGLEPEIFTNSTEYDAINRPTKAIMPHSASMPASEMFPSYNEAGLMEKVEVKIRGAAIIPFVSNINYNAKGQRESIFYGNGTKTKYSYDKDSFRLTNILTTRTAGNVVLQDLKYTYDATGNITRVKDNAQADIFFDNEMAQALNDYEYDAIYRLVKASGRKHAGQTDIQSKAGLMNNSSFRDRAFMKNPGINPNDANAFRNYTEAYTYDKVGNIKEQKHVSKNSSWTRSFEYDNNNNLNNRMTRSSINGDDYDYSYDAHGNMLGLETVQNEVWDFMDHFRQADLGGGGTVYFVYDGSGQRLRKVTERQNGMIQERIYLGGIEIFRQRNNANAVTLERETLHVMDDTKRIAMIDTPVIKPAGNNETQLIRYQYSNHLGSSSLELDDAASIISYEEYFPYGTTSYSTVDAGREVAAKRYRYTGKERDEETGLNYHGARYYALWLIRWTAADPIGIEDGLNLYVYVSGNPVSLADPGGTQGIGNLDPPKYGYEQKKFDTFDECVKGTWTTCRSVDEQIWSNGAYYGDVPRNAPAPTIAPPPPPPKPEPKKPKPAPKEENKGRELTPSELFDLAESFLPRYKYSPTYYRITGSFKLVFSGLEIVGGLYATPETLGGGLIIVGNGLDNGQAAAREIWTGESAKTLKYHLSYKTAEAFGADPKLSNAFGQLGDFTGNVVSGGIGLKVATTPFSIVEGEPYQVMFYHGAYQDRHVFTVGTPNGPRAFYVRTGGGGTNAGGAQAGDFAPFDGFSSQRGIFEYQGSFYKASPGWFVKHRYGAGLTENNQLYRFGTTENLEISQWLGKQNLPLPGPAGPWQTIQPELEFFGVPTIDPIPHYGEIKLPF